MSPDDISHNTETALSDSANSKSESPLAIKEARYTLRPALDRLSKANPANVMEVASSQLELMNHYHNAVIGQAQQSFRWALIAAGTGLLFLLISVGLAWFRQLQDAAIISLISGVLIEFISAINFFLYGKTSLQLAEFQSRLDVTQRFLIANSISESMEGDLKQQARLELVRTISGIQKGAPEEKPKILPELEHSPSPAKQNTKP